MHETGAAGVDAAGEEGHAEGFVVGYALQGAEDVGAFEVLGYGVSMNTQRIWGLERG